MSRWCSNQLSYAPAIGHLFSLRIILATRLKWKREFEFFGWFPSSGLGTLILQAPAWPFFGKLELQKPHSQAGAWERATQQLSAKVTHVGRQQLPLGQNRRDKDTRIHQASKLIGVCRRGWQVSFHGGPGRFCFALNVASLRRCVKHSFAFLAMRHVIQWAKVFLSHATTQRKSASVG